MASTLDEDKVMRCVGRLRAAHLTQRARSFVQFVRKVRSTDRQFPQEIATCRCFMSPLPTKRVN